MPDTAVADPVTAAPPESAPDLLEPLAAPTDAPPDEGAGAPDPEVPPERAPYTPTVEELAAALAAMADEELETLAPVTSLVARKNESVRRKTEAAANAERYTAEQQYASSDAVIRDLTEIARAAADEVDDRGNPIIDPKAVSRATTAVLARGVAVSVNSLSQLLEEQSGPDFALTAVEADGIAAAQVLYHRNPLDPTPLYRAFMGPFVRSQVEAQRAAVRAELTPVIRREEQDRIKAAAAAAAGETRSASAPTALNGTSASTAPKPADLTTYLGIAQAKINGQITEEEGRAALRKLG